MNIDKLDEIYNLIRKTGYIQSVNIYRNMKEDSTKEYNLTLVFSTCPYYEGDTIVKFIFHNVQVFELGDINNFYKVFLEIADVGDRQLENIRYYVNEIEYNMISFGCADFEYEII